jgi:sulfur carrier protein
MVGDLLVMQQLNPAHVVIEINGTILAKDTYAVTRIQPDDRIEILRFVGGG